MEISLININVSYKRVTSAWFSELFLCLKNNQPKIILCQRDIFGVANSAPFHGELRILWLLN